MATPTTLPSTFVAGNVLTAAQMNNLRGAFRVLQVVSTTKTDTFTTTSTTYTDITGATATITPSSTSSLIYVTGTTFMSGQSGTTSAFVRLARGGTGIAVGAAAGSRVQAASTTMASFGTVNAQTLDNPATTSATTYSIQVRAGTAGTVYINRTQGDADAVNDSGRFVTTITVMEISA